MALRLTSPVDGTTSPVTAAFTAVVIAPMLLKGRLAIASGTRVWGHRSRGGRDRHSRPVLQLTFDSLATSGAAVPVALRIISVDNMRESVDSTGLILGAAARSALRSKPVVGGID